MGKDGSRHVLQHLANERTLLSWMRTIVAISGVAYALVKLLETHGNSAKLCWVHIVAMGLPLFGVIATIYATINYFGTRVRIDGKFVALQNRSLANVFGILVGVVLIAVFALIMQFMGQR
ncbi:YidH family protein [Alicyclobacillus fastidiosus]|uniref:DUF202 domain-containing protein n=1 Tax=Alicyclobacillus fastidiosus TaxID=392011 RepID=A0ABV5AJA4_9BACL|nr:DUF202 domain-containing protein [Alicyclobacillus fastidiosus]WEH09091.1 DUF202 domain-containing protein [Alicyclobacillus fastidiosus]